MVRAIPIALIIASLTLTSLAQADDAKEGSAVDTTAFAVDLYSHVSQKKGNLFFSPTSIESALAMTYVGAKGTTADQMAKVLHFNGGVQKVGPAFSAMMQKLNNPPDIGGMDTDGKPIRKPAYELVIANALWGQEGYPFDLPYIQRVQQGFAGGLNSVDYRQPEPARTTINNWMAKQTKDKIKDLIAQGVLKPDTRLVLTNAIYFKSNWGSQFQKSATQDGPFTTSDGQAVTVPLMHQREHFNYAETSELQLVELPYVLRELSMIVVLPRKTDGLPALEKNLTADNLCSWTKQAKSESVVVSLPRFTFSAEFELADTLAAMGMTDAFNPDKADFTGMTTAEPLYISAVIHKAFVAVDEDGTEAAAATAITMRAGAVSNQAPPKVFKADHPFLFFIRHNATGEILFAGRVSNPKEQ